MFGNDVILSGEVVSHVSSSSHVVAISRILIGSSLIGDLVPPS